MKKIIFLADIDLSLSPKTRNDLDTQTIGEYAEDLKKKQKLPPPVVWQQSDGRYLVVDGHHRISAYKSLNVKAVTCEVLSGNRESAVIEALKANIHHGLRRTNADKRQCAATALLEFPKMSNAQLAEICEVGDELVQAVRKQLEDSGKVQKTETRIARNGNEVPAAKPRSTTVKNKGKDESKAAVEPVPVRSVQPKSEPVETDDTGYPIPVKALVFWGRAPEVDSMLASISGIRSQIKKAVEAKDALYAEVNFSALSNDLDRVYSALKQAVPYAVCFGCQGQLPAHCKVCNGRGVVSKFRFDTTCPEELKRMRSKYTQDKGKPVKK